MAVSFYKQLKLQKSKQENQKKTTKQASNALEKKFYK